VPILCAPLTDNILRSPPISVVADSLTHFFFALRRKQLFVLLIEGGLRKKVGRFSEKVPNFLSKSLSFFLHNPPVTNTIIMDFIFSFPMRVRDYECDIQGIVNNANYLHYLEVGRHEFIESRGVEFADLHRRGIDVVVAQAEIKFKRSLQPRDHFEVRVAVEKRGLRYTFHQEIVRSADPLRAATDTSYAKPVLCIRAQTDIVAIVDGRLSDCAELNEKFGL
jgi:acyl-coA thioester hydrolase, ybgC/ybaW family